MLLFTFLQAAEGAQGNSMWSMVLMMGGLFVVMYLFMIRPQQKKQKELKKMREALGKGDKVITAGGIYGVIVDIKENYVILEVDSNVKIRVDRTTIFRDTSDLPQQQK